MACWCSVGVVGVVWVLLVFMLAVLACILIVVVAWLLVSVMWCDDGAGAENPVAGFLLDPALAVLG